MNVMAVLSFGVAAFLAALLFLAWLLFHAPGWLAWIIAAPFAIVVVAVMFGTLMWAVRQRHDTSAIL
jgi:hypothetical protein